MDQNDILEKKIDKKNNDIFEIHENKCFSSFAIKI